MPNSKNPTASEQVDETRLYQMDTTNIEYRLQQLENELLPRRLNTVEIKLEQMIGEVTAIKEIARGIGIKVDSGIEKLSTDNNLRLQELKLDAAKNYAFVKGVMWVGGVIAVLIGMGPIVGDVVKRLLGS